MSLLSLTPLLETPDLEATRVFYTEVLGFSCVAFSEADGWMSLQLDATEVMFSLPNAHRAFTGPGLTGSLYFRTDAADTLWERLRGRCTVCYPIETFPYGMREFGIYDNNGYLLQFGEECVA